MSMKNFWQELPRPIMILAPMEDVTDTVFRRIVASCGRPDVYFTEFTSVDGLFSQGHDQVAKRLKYTEEERPLVAQIWGTKPENFYKAAQELVEMGFDGIDLNMGCPEKRVVKQGACSALIKNPGLAKEIIQATKEGAKSRIPLSVKTRIGFHEIATEEWTGFLLDQGLDALTVHARTVKEMSDVPAHWEKVGKVVKLRNNSGYKTLIIGNGDIKSLREAEEKIALTGADGVMIGRGIFHDPWLFNKERHGDEISFQEKVDKLIEHMSLFESTWGKQKPFHIMKKFIKCYITVTPGASELRSRLMTCSSQEEITSILRSLDYSAFK